MCPLSPRAHRDPHDQAGDQRPERGPDAEDAHPRGGDQERDDGAFPFADVRAGDYRALVCFGCTRESDGEHSFYTGGDWTCIDTKGRELQPRRHIERGQIARITCGYAD